MGPLRNYLWFLDRIRCNSFNSINSQSRCHLDRQVCTVFFFFFFIPLECTFKCLSSCVRSHEKLLSFFSPKSSLTCKWHSSPRIHLLSSSEETITFSQSWSTSIIVTSNCIITFYLNLIDWWIDVPRWLHHTSHHLPDVTWFSPLSSLQHGVNHWHRKTKVKHIHVTLSRWISLTVWVSWHTHCNWKLSLPLVRMKREREEGKNCFVCLFHQSPT